MADFPSSGSSAPKLIKIAVLGAAASLTVLRGKVVVEDGNFMGDVKDGRFLPRQISEHIRTGARL